MDVEMMRISCGYVNYYLCCFVLSLHGHSALQAVTSCPIPRNGDTLFSTMYVLTSKSLIIPYKLSHFAGICSPHIDIKRKTRIERLGDSPMLFRHTLTLCSGSFHIMAYSLDTSY